MRSVTARRLLACSLLLASCESGDTPDDISLPAGTGGGAAGGGAAGAGAGASMYGFEATVMPLVDEACRCHQTEPALMAPFSLKRGEAYDQLIGVASIDVPSMVRVAPGSLNDSYLWHKVLGTQVEVMGKGQIMPPGVPLNESERDVFARWIVAGAPR
jgi:hypothetical protein